MPAKYQIFRSLQLKYVTIESKTELSELKHLSMTYLEDPEFSFEHRQLIDLSGLVDANAAFKDVFTLRNFYIRTYSKAAKPVPVAIFAPTDLGYGISRMFTSLMIGQKVMTVKIFEFLPDALSWLEIDVNSQVWKDTRTHLETASLPRVAIKG
jgi:hypothetical protein